MSEREPFYITTTLPYVNSTPHIGFAMELVRADVVARYKEFTGHDVFFNTGTDEHGAKIYEKAIEAGQTPQEFVDEAVEPFKNLLRAVDVHSDVHFIRTTDEHHVKAAQEFWKQCEKDIYKGTYEVKYCVGCELEKTESDLNDEGRCPVHPNRDIEIREEENYFFAFSKYQDKLLSLYKDHPDFVVPSYRMNEILSFVEQGLQDFSISRRAEKMPWGVPVPGDEEHVMYVWFDALVNYISTLGWSEDASTFEKYWVNGTPVQYAGKDNLRQQSAMWQAMLMSAGISNSHQIVINGFINSGGQKMSKSLGNVIDPQDLIRTYGADALRYYVTRELSPFEDSDVTLEKFHEAYNANLVNGLGNQVSRVMNMVVSYDIAYDVSKESVQDDVNELWSVFETYNMQSIMDAMWAIIKENDESITEKRPFEIIKTDRDKAEQDLHEVVRKLYTVAVALQPFMPETALTVQRLIESKEKPEQPLFPRIEA